MPPIKHTAARNRHAGPYARPERSGSDRRAQQDSPSDEGDRPRTGASIIGTPGRIISGVFSFLASPWSRKREDHDDSLNNSSDAESTENGPAVQNRELAGRDSAARRSGAVIDPDLRSFAAELEAKFPSSSVIQGRQCFRDEDREMNSPQMLFRQSSDAVPKTGPEASPGTPGDRSLYDGREGLVCRPRAIPKTSALAVACIISRMGVANRERKRRIAGRLALKLTRNYTILPDPPAPNSAEPSAFRVVVARPCPAPSPPRPMDVARSFHSSSRGGFGGPAQSDLSMVFSDRKSRLNNVSSSSLGASLQDSVVGNVSYLGTSVEAMNGSVLSRRANTMNDSISSVHAVDLGLSAKEFSERALSCINIALKPLTESRPNPPAARAARDHFTPVESIRSDTSCPASMRVGDKRVRDSFAPEPSSTRKLLDHEGKEPPSQRRRVAPANAPPYPVARGANPKATHTVRRILDIIKDTSGPPRPAPPPSALNHAIGEDSRMAGSFGLPDAGAGSRSSGSASQDLGADTGSGGRRFVFSAPEPTGIRDEPAGAISFGAVPKSARPFTFCDPDDSVSEIVDARGASEVSAWHTAVPAAPNRAERESERAPMSKAQEREEQKRVLAAKAGVPTTFQWPTKKVDVSLEPSGNRELDEEDGFQKAPAVSSTAAGSKAAASAPAGVNGVSSSLPSLADMFKPKPGEWRCDVCKSLNKPDAGSKCLSCETPKPGAATSSAAPPAAATQFLFGASTPAPSASQGGFVFGAAPAGAQSAAQVGFKFGGDTSGTVGGFKFGVDSALKAADAGSDGNKSTAPLFGASASSGPAFSFGSDSSQSKPPSFHFGTESTKSSAPAFTFGAAPSSGTSAISFSVPAVSETEGKSSTFGFTSGAPSSFGFSGAGAGSGAAGKSSAAAESGGTGDAGPSGVGKLGADETRKAKEREEQKKALALKAGVPTKFQWPDKKVDVGLEASGNKELDEEDKLLAAAAPSSSAPSQVSTLDSSKSAEQPKASLFSFGAAGSSSAAASSSAPAFSFGGSTSVAPTFTFGASGTSVGATSSAVSSGTSQPAVPGVASTAPVFSFGAAANSGSSLSGAQTINGAATANKADPAPTATAAAPFSFSSGTSVGSSGTSAAPSFGGASGLFSFGASSSSSAATSSVASAGQGTSSGPPSFTFGAAAGNASSSAPSSTFSFGASAAPPGAVAMPTLSASGTTATFGFGSSKAAEASTPAFVFGGQAGQNAASSTPSQFGAAAAPPAGTFTFGAAATKAQPSTTGVPSAPQADGMMADDEQAAPAAPAPSAGFAFGGFGAGAAAPSASSATFSFGAPSTGGVSGAGGSTSGAGFTFGGGGSNSSFGFSAPSAAPAFGAATGGFGAPASAPAFGSGGFGASSNGAGAGFSFGGPSSSAAAPMFGAGTGAPSFGAGAGGFGASASGGFSFNAPTAGTAAPTFGAPGSAPAFGSGFGAPSSTPGFGFGAAGNGAAQPAFGGFGAPSAAAAPPAFGFGAPASAAAPAFGGFGAQTSAAPAPAFGGFGAQTSAAPAPAFGGFGAQTSAAPAPAFGGFGASGAPAAGFGGGGGFGAAAGAAAPPAGEVPQRKMIKAKRSTGQGRGRGH